MKEYAFDETCTPAKAEENSSEMKTRPSRENEKTTQAQPIKIINGYVNAHQQRPEIKHKGPVFVPSVSIESKPVPTKHMLGINTPEKRSIGFPSC